MCHPTIRALDGCYFVCLSLSLSRDLFRPTRRPKEIPLWWFLAFVGSAAWPRVGATWGRTTVFERSDTTDGLGWRQLYWLAEQVCQRKGHLSGQVDPLSKIPWEI